MPSNYGHKISPRAKNRARRIKREEKTLVDALGMREQIGFRLCAPQAAVARHDLGQLGEERIGLALFGKIVDGGEWQGDVVVDQLLAAGDLGQVLGGFRRRVQAADVRNHARGLERALGDHAQRLDHIRGVAAAGAHDVRGRIMHIVEYTVR